MSTPENYASFLLKNYDNVFEDAVEHTHYEDVVKAHGKEFLEKTREFLGFLEKEKGRIKDKLVIIDEATEVKPEHFDKPKRKTKKKTPERRSPRYPERGRT